MAGALLERLVNPTVFSTTHTVVYTATSKTHIRTMDISVSDISTGPPDTYWVTLNGTTTAEAFYFLSTSATGTFEWRGGMVLNTGDTIGIDTSTVTSAAGTITICGVTGLPSS